MRTITQVLLALGFVGAIALGAPATTKAQQIQFSGLGVDVEIGNRPDRFRNYRQYDRDSNTYYAHDRRPNTQRHYNDGLGYSWGRSSSEYGLAFAPLKSK